MTVLQRIQREPAKLLAFAAAILAVLTGTGVLTQIGATIALGVVASAIGLLSYFVTPAGEVVAQQLPSGTVLAGRASQVANGRAVAVDVQPLDLGPHEPGEHRRGDAGATDLQTIGAALVIAILVAAALVLVIT